MASHHVHFVEDQELNPIVFAEQFADSDPSKAQTPEEILVRARMILSTEIGKDPLLRSQIRKIFKEEAQISVEPTERGITKIDDNHSYYVGLRHKSVHRTHLIATLELQVPPPQKHKKYAGFITIFTHISCRSGAPRQCFHIYSKPCDIFF